MIVNFRGTNGSGKSTIVRGLLEACSKPRAIYGVLGFREPEAYELVLSGVARPVFILGPYQTNTGGCDRIQPYDLILTLLDKYAARGHVVLEGDTPLEVCLANIARRTAGGTTQHVAKKYEAIQKVRGLFIENDKLRVEDVSMDNGLERILSFLKEEG